MSSLNMLIETKAGSEYTGAECVAWLQQAGFREMRIEPLADAQTAVIAIPSAVEMKEISDVARARRRVIE